MKTLSSEIRQDAHPSNISMNGEASRPLCLPIMEPWQAFFGKVLSRWPKQRGLIEGADMEMRFCRQIHGFAGQGGAAPCAKSARCFPRRRIEPGYLAFDNLISFAVERYEYGDRRAGMPSTALAMAPIHPFWFADRDKADSAA